MNIIDSGELKSFFLDPDRKIPSAHAKNVCLLERKPEACRYASLLHFGFVCMKKSPLKNTLDQLVKDEKMIRRGDNCEGLGEIGKNNEKK